MKEFIKTNKNDYLLVGIIGILVGWLILPTLSNIIHSYIDTFTITPAIVVVSVLGFSILAQLGLAIVFFLAKFWPGLRSFGKFCAVGVLNTILAFAVLNSMMRLTGITNGGYYTLFTAMAFFISVTNSYFWNKFWSFQSKTSANATEYSGFLLATFIGLLINSGVASFFNNMIGPLWGIAPTIWANLSALSAIAFSFVWNYFSYRLLFIKPKQQNSGGVSE